MAHSGRRNFRPQIISLTPICRPQISTSASPFQKSGSSPPWARGGDEKGEEVKILQLWSNYGMFHVTWTTFKFNRNQLRTVLSFVMISVPWNNNVPIKSLAKNYSPENFTAGLQLQVHYAIYRLRFYSNSLIHILSLSNSHKRIGAINRTV